MSTRFPARFLTMTGFALIAVVGLIAFAGCEEEPEMHADHDHGAHAHEGAAAEEAEVAAVTVQETCPVMGSPINEELFVEYQGKKVYFCCAGCPEKFLENPEQYVAKLPQFQE